MKRLEAKGETTLLERLSSSVKPNKLRGKKHEVWQNSFDWKECIGHSFMNQKLDYMHNNLARLNGTWRQGPVDYLHGSARNYLCGEQRVYSGTNVRELYDIDLTRWASDK